MSVYWDAVKFYNLGDKNELKRQVFRAAEQKKIKTNPKQIFALLLSVWKFKRYLLEVVKNSKILSLENSLNEDVVVIISHDLLLSKNNRIQMGKTKLKETILKHKTRLLAEYIKLKLKYGVQDLNELVVEEPDDDRDSTTPVRWVRVNTIRTKLDVVLKDLNSKGFEKVTGIENILPKQYYIDEYVPNLIGFSPKTKITSFKSYQSGEIIIQDRASCFPAFILNPKPGHDVAIDACAAPGNKTTHLAMMMNNHKQSVYAFERDQKRGSVLKKMLKIAGTLNCVTPKVADFTSTDPREFECVTCLLVDPSCSGSGIFDRSLKQEYDENRLLKLSSFQFSIMRHALSFPNANRVIYSTCSIHAQENERVVCDLLTNPDIKDAGWRLATRDEIMPNWPRRGLPEEFASDFDDGEKLAGGCIRVKPKEDGGIGFFAALFIRDPQLQPDDDDHENEEGQHNDSDLEVFSELNEDFTTEDEKFEENEEWAGFD